MIDPAELYTEEKIRGFLHLHIGEEAIAVGVMQCLTPEDAVIATYREHGHALVRGMPMTTLMADQKGAIDVEVFHDAVMGRRLVEVGEIVPVGTPGSSPWVLDGQVVPRTLVTTTLSADHRQSDGHRGALFLAQVGQRLQEPETL